MITVSLHTSLPEPGNTNEVSYSGYKRVFMKEVFLTARWNSKGLVEAQMSNGNDLCWPRIKAQAPIAVTFVCVHIGEDLLPISVGERNIAVGAVAKIAPGDLLINYYYDHPNTEEKRIRDFMTKVITEAINTKN